MVRPKRTRSSTAGSSSTQTTTSGRSRQKKAKTSTEEKGAAAKPAPKKSTRSGPLEVGSVAPDFTVKDEGGNEVTLASLKGKNVVLYFYPKDNTPGCTKEAVKFRDLKAEYDALDCVILGVSADHETSHTKFIEKYELNFSLLADTNKALIKDYGATKPGDKIQRSTVIIDKEGKIAAVWNPVSGAETHPEFVLEKLKEIASAK